MYLLFVDVYRRMNLLRRANVTRQSKLTPNAKAFYKISKGLLNTARQLFTENASNKERLEEAIRATKYDDIFNANVNPITMAFINSQVRLQKRKSRGRRFTLEDKVLGLTLLKQSPKCYRVLKTIFALPSRRTLMRMLNKLPFYCGINPHIIHNLSNTIKSMNPLDTYCSLIFDEIFIEPS